MPNFHEEPFLYHNATSSRANICVRKDTKTLFPLGTFLSPHPVSLNPDGNPTLRDYLASRGEGSNAKQSALLQSVKFMDFDDQVESPVVLAAEEKAYSA